MSDDINNLSELLKAAGAKPTFDPGRSNTHPCTFCATTAEPRELVDIGTYYDGSTLTRPVCTRCRPLAEPRKEGRS